MPNNNQLSDLMTRVTVVEHEVDIFAKLFERLDKTLSTLSDVSNSIQKLLAVHENRLDNNERINNQLETFYKSSNKELSILLKELRSEIKYEMEIIEKEIHAINKWKWAIYGGCAVLGFIIANILPRIPL